MFVCVWLTWLTTFSRPVSENPVPSYSCIHFHRVLEPHEAAFGKGQAAALTAPVAAQAWSLLGPGCSHFLGLKARPRCCVSPEDSGWLLPTPLTLVHEGTWGKRWERPRAGSVLGSAERCCDANGHRVENPIGHRQSVPESKPVRVAMGTGEGGCAVHLEGWPVSCSTEDCPPPR